MKTRAFGTYAIATICQVAPITVGRWIEEGKLPFFTTGGGHRRVWEQDLLKFLRAHNYPIPADLIASQKSPIVIVNDDPSDKKSIYRSFSKKFPQATVSQASDGFQAGEMISSLKPSLVVLNITQPGMDSTEICRRIRLNKSLQKVKIVLIEPPLRRGKKNTPNSFPDHKLSRPLDMSQLITVAAKLLKN